MLLARRLCLWRGGPVLAARLSSAAKVGRVEVSSSGERAVVYDLSDESFSDDEDDADIDAKPGSLTGSPAKKRTKLFDRTRRFADVAYLEACAGKGGDGCMAFLREKFRPDGGPAGGDGGRGGSVLVRASANTTSLHNVPSRVRGENGESGKGKLRHGRNGKDIVLSVPVGTVVMRRVDDPASESDSDMSDAEDSPATYEQIADLADDGASLLLSEGGKGGKGNARFVTSTERAPRHTTPGETRAPLHFQLELKTLADIGLVGLPNAGKSTLLRAVSNAHPKVAPYPFTTLNPFVGVIEYRDYHRLSMADIPGLIAGAHLNRGLGHQFLRHIERSRVLVYVVDLTGGVVDASAKTIENAPFKMPTNIEIVTPPTPKKGKRKSAYVPPPPTISDEDLALLRSPGRTPWGDLAILQNELERYRDGLSRRPAVVVANKLDVTNDGITARNLEELRRRTDLEVIPVAAIRGENVTALTARLRVIVEGLNKSEGKTM